MQAPAAGLPEGNVRPERELRTNPSRQPGGDRRFVGPNNSTASDPPMRVAGACATRQTPSVRGGSFLGILILVRDVRAINPPGSGTRVAPRVTSVQENERRAWGWSVGRRACPKESSPDAAEEIGMNGCSQAVHHGPSSAINGPRRAVATWRQGSPDVRQGRLRLALTVAAKAMRWPAPPVIWLDTPYPRVMMPACLRPGCSCAREARCMVGCWK